MDLLSNFRNQQLKRSQIQCSDSLAIWLDYLQYSIHTEFDKNTKQIYKYKKHSKKINQNFRNALENLNRQQKVQLYLRLVQHLINLSKGIQQAPYNINQLKQYQIEGQCETRSFNIKKWKLKRIRLDRKRHQIMVQRQDKIKLFNLRDYILRKSKITDMYVLVLQGINDNSNQKSRTVHISFRDQKIFKKWLQLIRQQVYYSQWLNVKQMYSNKEKMQFSLVLDSKYTSSIQNNSKLQQSQTSAAYQNINSNFKNNKKNEHENEHSLLNESASTIPMKSQINSPRENNKLSQIQEKLFLAEEQLDKQQQDLNGKRKTFIQNLVNDNVTNFDQLFDQLENQTQVEIQKKKNLDIFHKLMPQYQLLQLKELSGYITLVNQFNNDFQIYQSMQNTNRFKILLNFKEETYTPQQIFTLISQPQFTKQINDGIQSVNIKTLVKSQNSAIIYQVHKAQNKFYRQRDFILIRHAFTHNNNVYIADKSIDNINFPPFITLVRGQMNTVWCIFKEQKQKKIKLMGDLTIINGGLLNIQQELNLTLKYLNGYKLFLTKVMNLTGSSSAFDLNWNIDNQQINKQNQDIRIRRKTIQIQKSKIVKQNQKKEEAKSPQFTKKSSAYVANGTTSSPENKKVKQVKQVQIHQIQPKVIPIVQSPVVHIKKQKIQNSKAKVQHKVQNKLKQTIKQTQKKLNSVSTEIQNFTEFQVKRSLEKNGYVIVDKRYINRYFHLKPLDKKEVHYWPKIQGHCIWKGDWIHDQKNGGIIFINQKKIQDQKGVLKFILTKIGKNILSGKSVLNISLPVDIFAPQSNLQRLLLSMAYAPKTLQNLNGKKTIEKLMNVVKFGLTNSILYLNMQKPFNPILGETFQCWLNGCPGYGQQISHHPPIAALMFYGRGYRITCQLQSKVQLHMNSGCGTNDGIYRIIFDDGTQICFITPGGQVSGLTYGDRKFNLVGKSYYWVQKQRIFMQIVFDAGKKGFFAKQQQPCDYFQGKLYEVIPQFFNTFPKTKKRQTTQKQRVKELGKFQGIWTKYIKFNNQQIFNLDSQQPISLQYQKLPLASDANWRQDIQYRRLNQVTRAQTQKQRLQVLQRGDRKFRQKYHKK